MSRLSFPHEEATEQIIIYLFIYLKSLDLISPSVPEKVQNALEPDGMRKAVQPKRGQISFNTRETTHVHSLTSQLLMTWFSHEQKKSDGSQI